MSSNQSLLQKKIDSLLGAAEGTLSATLGVTFLELSPTRVVATMPVVKKVMQPFGILHGGASVVLAESVASIGAWLNLTDQHERAVGVEINANHLRSVSDGMVTATAIPVRIGRSIHVWNIEILSDHGKLICVSRCTLAIVKADEG